MALSAADRLSEVTSFDESMTGVKGLSDAGVTSIPRFFIHPPATLSSLKSSVSLSIPVIDLSGLNSHRRLTIADQIKSAASTWGFFQVTNHGAPSPEMDGIVNAVKAFHEQPPEAKRVHYKREAGEKGFSYMSNVDLHRSKVASWHDHFHVHAPVEVDLVPEICRREVVEWDARVTRVGEDLMEVLGEGLGLGSRRFRELAGEGGRLFAGVYYPYCPQPDLTVGLTSHTDGGLVTVLLPNGVAGLQVKHGEDWVDVKPVPGGLIVNVGDLLQIISNDEYKSVQHRVRANASSEPRISAVMIFNLGKPKETDELLGPLPELLSPENPPKYRNFTVGEFTETLIVKEVDNKTLIDTFKINNDVSNNGK